MTETKFRETVDEYSDLIESAEIFRFSEEENISQLRAKKQRELEQCQEQRLRACTAFPDHSLSETARPYDRQQRKEKSVYKLCQRGH